MQTLARTLAEWLAHCEQLHARPIDLGLERVRRVAERMQLRFDCTVITVAGTNGKGSTCAMLESIAGQAGWRTGVYTSPHLVRFEERCRIAGEAVAEADLLPQFARVEAARGDTTLSYFEFTTLAILGCLADARLDLAVLEVGLGGRLDAVNVIDADCAVITSIDLDHMEFLGPDRESIGFEKAGILRPGRPAVVSDPVPPASIARHAHAIGADLWQSGVDFNFSGDQQQWAWAGRGKRYSGLAYPALRGANQLLNAAGVLAALTAVRERLPIPAQAVRAGLALVELPGRFQIVPGQPTLVLDVAHNPHAASALAANLDAMGFFPNTHAVFGAMADKDLDGILRRMAPVVDRWYFCDLPGTRAARADELLQRWQALNTRKDASASAHAGPTQALAAAVGAADPADRILVFGSFLTVGGVLEQGLPKLHAKHLGR
ncbi:bifunctional tetrahydrofolate synthase/dihydrofolate synthase [Pseudorhodoferax sp. Leaf265]|jgi:dihydrofolate synthase/folylpolyglutamate synthase|uniref:bifunctional tetrahydrofolate synthase/dihydrofolate synthase n=1 Tax=Pseudorhodoferax sp. Leaf265 TaxID=1736315 RepID=UPI0006F98118|nr:bifunctional tetrahydrofolate synthase/dihydrofolate synthase [Pseudorhodoferax sp. Leaf265]KQP20959.1 bifunctional folylpolyglutamate synthase/dihydrofolate synthase [Pseudorhodoferax sp. Leaf265]PZP91972.1 MAG: bifunctional tetrahydrofolate synthase/dihydrofolate synthase [Variovorax paradoxus]PZQ02175.1 MAG: bifunctional tetrahydrofolate synthase/dihydrofolate synthase [Variovorax paradoxus]